MSRTREAHRRIQAEIAQEKAAALGRAGERLEAALEVLATVGRRLDVTRDAEARARLVGEYEDARARALHARLALLVQREAIGLRQHRSVDATYPEPPRRS
jgi:hypothetical protein